MRDFRVIKQNLDFSCGAASLATILNGFFGENLSEEDVLNYMELDGSASFKDLALVSNELGYKSGGLKLSFNTLKQLKIPVIAHLSYRGQDHFTVIRGISNNGNITVADPAWGNKRFRPAQFKKFWELIETDGEMFGNIILILPTDHSSAMINRNFFTKDVNFNNLIRSIHLY